MENNFPINEDLAYEKIRDLMFDMMEEDPNRFYALTDKLNELAALPLPPFNLARHPRAWGFWHNLRGIVG